MIDDLLVYYNRELSYARKLAREFSQANPDVAPRLGVEGETSRDPYVERLIEAFAYINARTRKKLDDDFPEIAEAMLGVLYPHYLAPTPSMAIAQFALEAGQATMFGGYEVPRGTRLETEEIDGVACEYRTCFPLRLFPLRVSEAALSPIAVVPTTPAAAGAAAAFRIRLETFSAQATLDKLLAGSLRFYLHGDAVHANAIYESIFSSALDVALVSGVPDRPPISLGRRALQSVGFEPDEGLLPQNPRTFDGYRLLTEYFALPEKFRFVDVGGLAPLWRECTGRSAELLIYVKRAPRDLANNVSSRSFVLGCTPIVNLFERTAEPLRLTQTRSSYPVIPDARWGHALEVYSIDAVSATTPEQRDVEIHPFYSTLHSIERDRQRVYWNAARHGAGYRDGRPDPGTEIELTFVDLDFNAASRADWTVEVQTTCLNRDLPSQLEFGAGRPALRSVAGGPLAPIVCITPPTATLRPALRHGTLWRLVSHLSLNHLSLVEGPKGAAVLQELLLLYEPLGTPDRLAKIQGLRSISGRRQTALITQGDAGLCRGTEVTVTFDEKSYADNGMFLLATVLERFLALYANINSFTQLAIRSQQRGEEVYRWPPRTGHRQLL
ncbi:MAG: type VI secretion system baseplate subunit TssF [Planctomycetia bacterium]|nr:MAG: type VI secretion system baseplate subunit TssF [Planctomycetia bacterium]